MTEPTKGLPWDLFFVWKTFGGIRYGANSMLNDNLNDGIINHVETYTEPRSSFFRKKG